MFSQDSPHAVPSQIYQALLLTGQPPFCQQPTFFSEYDSQGIGFQTHKSGGAQELGSGNSYNNQISQSSRVRRKDVSLNRVRRENTKKGGEQLDTGI